MAEYQGDTWWDSNLHVDVCPISRSPPYPLPHGLPKYNIQLARNEGRQAASSSMEPFVVSTTWPWVSHSAASSKRLSRGQEAGSDNLGVVGGRSSYNRCLSGAAVPVQSFLVVFSAATTLMHPLKHTNPQDERAVAAASRSSSTRPRRNAPYLRPGCADAEGDRQRSAVQRHPTLRY
ncbi:hypothetical protein E2C01_016886 [Portunus trituberculatus]|uniref:Uncharacterized protein n=1 Tax=Portunus trituberculatus TaxID=210409 RepID=A0A5B7DQ98_PORTR|nr:hypothetical protein [Portunus trituberculatus]